MENTKVGFFKLFILRGKIFLKMCIRNQWLESPEHKTGG